MTTKEIKNYLIKIKADPNQRIERDNGGQYLDNVYSFARLGLNNPNH
jgi:hypothetical protein